jgi:hypothetical protein
MPRNMAIATSFTSGEVIRKAKVTPSGMPALRNQTNKGIDEQVQKGVTAPNNEANKYSSQNNLFLARKFLIFSIGKYELSQVIKWMITIRRKMILILSYMKKLSDSAICALASKCKTP